MPHNRTKRQSEVDAKYAFVVYGHEYSITNAILAILDAIITGGVATAEYLRGEMAQFGIDLASAMARATPPVNPAKETLYVGKFIFENWEEKAGVRIPLPNKFVPYVAARKRWPAKTSPETHPKLSPKPDVTNIGHKPNGDAYILTDMGGGWLGLGDRSQDIRIWACAAAIWAARRAGSPGVDGTLYCQERVDTGDNAYFNGVQRIHLKTE
jgi:hypothetical protein